MKETESQARENSKSVENKEEVKTITDLWAESDKIRQEIIDKPLKHPLKYLKIILFEGK